MGKIFLFILSMVLLVSMMSIVDVMAEDEVFFTFGTVKNLSQNTLVIEETVYDEENGTETTKEVIYNITPGTNIENADIKNISAGMEIDVEYTENAEGKNAVYIYIYAEDTADEF